MHSEVNQLIQHINTTYVNSSFITCNESVLNFKLGTNFKVLRALPTEEIGGLRVKSCHYFFPHF